MKKTALDILKEDRARLVESIVKGLEEKGIGWLKEWSNFASQQNGTTNTDYKGGNKVKLGVAALENGYNDPRWATMNQIKEKGWILDAKSKGVLCEFWKFKEVENSKDKTKNSEEEKSKNARPIRVSYFTVYNFSKIKDKEGKPLEPFKIPERPKEIELQNILTKLEKTSKCAIEYLAQDRAYYNTLKDIIVMPTPDLFKNDLGQISTLLHEMAHSTGHKDRLDRSINNAFGTPEYAREELRAEISSVFLQSSLGVINENRDFNNNQEYIKSWISLLKNDPNEIYRAASDAEKISDYILKEYKEIEKSLDLEKETKKEEKVIEIKSPLAKEDKDKDKDISH